MAIKIVNVTCKRVASGRIVSFGEVVHQAEGQVAVAVAVRAIPVGVRLVHERSIK
jgi:hypothetical protein